MTTSQHTRAPRFSDNIFIAGLNLRCVRFAQGEECAAVGAARPVGVGFDEAGAGAYVGETAPSFGLFEIEAAPVVFQHEREFAGFGERDGEADVAGVGGSAG